MKAAFPRSLLLLPFLLLTLTSRAQLPILETQWTGTAATPQKTSVRLTFRPDSLRITDAVSGAVLGAMRYEQTGDTLLLRQRAGAFSCASGQVGAYRLIYTNNGENFSLQPLADDCQARKQLISSLSTVSRVRRNRSQPPGNWPYLDPKTDSVAGISLYRAYELLKNRPSVPVIVGVLDSGVDMAHEDLRNVIWTNPKEVADNVLDDDKNGYVDDRNGWNFMGAKDGTTSEYGQPEITQSYVLLKPKYETADPAKLNATEKRQYDTYQTAKKQFLYFYRIEHPKRLALADTARFWQVAHQIQDKLPALTTSSDSIRAARVGTDSVAVAVRNLLADTYNPQYGSFGYFLTLVRQNWTRYRSVVGAAAEIAYNLEYRSSKTIGDNPADPTERYYGSPTMRIGPSQQLAMHGSHVAGIIGAERGNGRGIDGVADNVRIMPVSVVPANGDERDKDVANGIRYAAENGAKVINMSFGKRLSPFKEQVDAAIRFAAEHDVLIMHAAGNNGENYDSLPSYPSAKLADGTIAPNVLVVGNSTWQVTESLPARSSNYGAQTVDLFAPGTDILSTIPREGYASFTGTSMASPMAAGVAALLRSYFPKLTAVQVKEILIKSCYKPGFRVRQPGRTGQLVSFSSLCQSGGILNAYDAVKLALSL